MVAVQRTGQVAEWSCSGLQSRVRRFDSDPGLQCERESQRPCGAFFLRVPGNNAQLFTCVFTLAQKDMCRAFARQAFRAFVPERMRIETVP